MVARREEEKWVPVCMCSFKMAQKDPLVQRHHLLSKRLPSRFKNVLSQIRSGNHFINRAGKNTDQGPRRLCMAME